MSSQSRTRYTRGARSFRHWRRVGVALLMGLALSISACGATTGGGPRSTPTPRPTATTAPVSCVSWRSVSGPTGVRYPMSILNAVSALSPTSAWVVGANYAAGDTIGPVDSLIEQWDGATWRVVANTGHEALNAITAISPNDIWAVGGQLNYGVGTGILIMRWDGTKWSIAPSAQPAGATFAALDSAVGIASNDVWAVGRQDTSSAQLLQPLIERWDGAAWRIVGSPLPQGATNGVLSAVTRIPATNQLLAVGEWSKYSVPSLPQPLIERWDGASWRIDAAPALPSGAVGGAWNGVVAVSATNAWAVGFYYRTNPVDRHPLIARWDGTRWTTVFSPNTSGELNSVAATDANDVRAAGSLLIGAGGNSRRIPFIERWNGGVWQIMSVPEPNGVMSGSLNIATDGLGDYWAVGSYYDAARVYQPLILRCP